MHSSSLQQQYKQRWVSCYQALRCTSNSFGVLQQIEYRTIEDFHIISNNQYKNKRITNSIDKALEVKDITIPFSKQGFNFTKIKQGQIICAVDVDKHQWFSSSSNESSCHFIIISGCPITQGHSLFIPFLQEKHPQIMTAKLFKLSLEIASMLPKMKFGFNSQGAASSVNHFHFQMMDCTTFLPLNRFIFQEIQGILMKDKDQVQITHFQWCNAHYTKIYSESTLIMKKQQVTSISMRIIDDLLKQNVPHNIVITDPKALFIIVRGFASQQQKYGWLEFCGVFVAKSKQQFLVDALSIKKSFDKVKIDSNEKITRLLKFQ